MEDVIPYNIIDISNNILKMTHSFEEIKVVVFNLNKDNSPSLDGFGGLFFQKYWCIINNDVCNVMIEFFTK